MKRYLVPALKFVLPVAIILWLLARVPPEQYRQCLELPKNWLLLVAALGVVLAAVVLTFVRWYLLVRTLGLRFRLADAFRLGFLGYLLNFVVVGSVGGDLFKAVFIAREQPGRRAEAVATVVVDRLVGFYALLLLTSLVILWGGIPRTVAEVAMICRLTLIVTAVATASLLLMLLPGFASGPLAELLTGLPRIGPVFGQLIASLRVYRARWGMVAVALVMSLGSHMLFTLSLYLIAHALFVHVPTFVEHMILVPLGMVAGGLPLAPAGFGAFEFAIGELYRIIPADPDLDVAGVLVALVYRLLTIAVAMIGVIVYWTSRREMQAVMADAEQPA
ncbi:MAG: flippase-like domain-containing protein [Pirellulaceae bacterium]|nr:flippase-like domain-containing protein [Pirellulaceae bacterium]